MASMFNASAFPLLLTAYAFVASTILLHVCLFFMQKEVYTAPRNREVTELQPCIQAPNVQSGLDKGEVVPMHSNTHNGRQAGLTSSSLDGQYASSDSKTFPVSPFLVQKVSVTGSGGQEEINLVKQRLMDTGSSLERDMQVEPITEEPNSLELRSSRKRPCMISSETASETSVETSMKTIDAMAWRENTGSRMFGRENEHKKMKFYSDGVSEEQILGDIFSSKMHCLHPSFQDKQQKDALVCEDKLKTSERHFFPVDPDPVRDLKSGSILPWQILSSSDEKLQEFDSPNLELALGAKNKPFMEALPLFVKLEDERSARNKLLDRQVKGTDDDASASPPSLALSLTLKEQTAKSVTTTEPLRQRGNTPLLLFGSLIDT